MEVAMSSVSHVLDTGVGSSANASVGSSATGRALGRPLIWGDVEGSQTATFALPAGTVTFLLSDIEGSTRLWQNEPEAMARAVPEHYALLEESVALHGGVRPVEQGEGDSIVAAFSRGSDAVAAALDIQRRMGAHAWPEGPVLRVRIALHTAEAQLRDEGNYFGLALSRCARLRELAHGGQVLLSGATHDLVVDRMPAGARLADRGVHRLRDLGRPEHVHELLDGDTPQEFPALRSLDALPNNLPGQLTSFVGRVTELREIQAALEGTRLLTLTGAGGCGKTRLALQAAADTVDRYPDGIWWVELAPVLDPEQLGSALATALSVRPLGGQTPLEAAVTHLAEQRALIVLDNCEHLLEASAVAGEALLRGAPGVAILATSRAPLGVAGETSWRVPSLSLPAERMPEPVEGLAQSDAVRLFIERALKVRPNFSISNDNAASVAGICHALDGIPLAIELAAARVRLMAVEEIATALADRFHLLTGGARGALPRQQTLRASVDWSYELLEEDERRLLRRLAVFTGGWTLDLAEDVTGGEDIERLAVLDLLGSLVDKSLVLVEDGEPSTRYRLLETVRQYGLDRLSQSPEELSVRDRHRDALLALAEEIEPHLGKADQHLWLRTLAAEDSNLTSALEHAVQTDPAKALRLAVALTFYWKLRGLFAAAESGYAQALDAAPADAPLCARALWGRAYLMVYGGGYEQAIEHAEEALELAEAAGDRSTMARALDATGTATLLFDPKGTRLGQERSLTLARESGDEWCVADATQILAWTYLWESRHEESLATAEEVLPLIERMGYREQLAWHWCVAAAGECESADWAACEEHCRRAIAAAREIGEPVTEGAAQWYLARTDLLRGRPEQALERLETATERAVRAGAGMVDSLLGCTLARAEAANGRGAEALLRLEPEIATGLDGGYMLAYALQIQADVHYALGDKDLAASGARQALEVAERTGASWILALACMCLASVSLDMEQWSEADGQAHRALEAIESRGLVALIPDALELLAEVAGGLHSDEEATRLLGAAEAARIRHELVRSKAQGLRAATLEQTLRGRLDSEGLEAAFSEGRALDAGEGVAWARRARGERKRPPGGWESLTPTELEVVRHAATGLTNPQIGEQMFITRGTVKVHLSHIYAKLGMRNRSELAAEAARRQLGTIKGA
jgi:predicted ATPase/class 3 adenylate cyclase/DNA-binding CsgD family transcriptional regulator